MTSGQKFTITTSTTALIDAAKVKGSVENSDYFEFMKTSNAASSKIDVLKDALKTGKGDSTVIEKQIEEAVADIKSTADKLMAKHPEYFFSKMLLSTKDISIPQEIEKMDEGTGKKVNAYQYYKQHYWDNFDLSDDRMIYTKSYYTRLNNYFENLTMRQNPDSVIANCDFILDKVSDSKELFKFTTVYLVNKYQKPKLMGDDKIYVHLVQNYLNAQKCFWLDTNAINRLQTRANDMAPSIIGNIAPDLNLPDTLNQLHQLHAVDAPYTLLYFYGAGCGRCKKETPQYVEVYQKYKYLGIKTYTVCTTTASLEEWKAFQQEKFAFGDWINVIDPKQGTAFNQKYDVYSIPLCFLLDKDKRIIAKQLNPEQLEKYIENYILKK